jgi:leucyl aminopeptidase
MLVKTITTSSSDTIADAAIYTHFAGEPLSGELKKLDELTGGTVARCITSGAFSGKRLELLSLPSPTGTKFRTAVVVGLGERDVLDIGAAYRSGAAAARALSAKSHPTVACFFSLPTTNADLVEAAVCGVQVGCQGQDIYRKEKNRYPFESLLWQGESSGVCTGQILADGVNLARRLVNAPPDDIYPATFAEEAAQVAKQTGMTAEIWDQARLEKERCGSLLAVNKGSDREPRLVILQHRGGKPNASTLAIVGKGVTFDSGGLSLKTSEQMIDMKCDMAGAAAMLGAMQAISSLKLPVNVIGLCGLVENMTGPSAMKLGDVLTARNGTTIEVLNTDAEGRLVLADVLDVAVERGASKIVDLATLTGACMVALGSEVAGLMANDQTWCDAVATAARACGEPVWQLPMYADIYDELIKSEVADIKNVGDGRYGGAITAAKFLEQFVGKVPWTHIDIAGPAFRSKAKPWAEAGASGQYVRTLVQLARNWQ